VKLFGTALVLGLALLISIVAGSFSVVGLAALFVGAYWPVIVMGSVLEAAKLCAAGWLHANWRNPRVSRLHRAYVTAAVAVLMALTSLGIFGFLSKAHLEQEAPIAGVQLKIDQIERKITMVTAERDRLIVQLNQLDQSVSTALTQAKGAKDAKAAATLRDRLKKERTALQAEVSKKDEAINALVAEVTPLKASTADLSAKLGPIRYVAELFGWSDPNSAVRLVILMIMFAFDPLAVAMVLSGTISLREYLDGGDKPEGSSEPEPDLPRPPSGDHEPVIHTGIVHETSVISVSDGEFHWKTPDPHTIPVSLFGEPVQESHEPVDPVPAQEPAVPAQPPVIVPAPAPVEIIIPEPPHAVPAVVHQPPALPVAPPPPPPRPVTLTPDLLDEPMSEAPPKHAPAPSGWLGEPWFSNKSK
jgi:hypothetical protein